MTQSPHPTVHIRVPFASTPRTSVYDWELGRGGDRTRTTTNFGVAGHIPQFHSEWSLASTEFSSNALRTAKGFCTLFCKWMGGDGLTQTMGATRCVSSWSVFVHHRIQCDALPWPSVFLLVFT